MTNEEYQRYKEKHYKDESLFLEQKAVKEKQRDMIINRIFAIVIFITIALTGSAILILTLRSC